MKNQKKYKPLFWFYVVCAYVVLQLIWWGILLYRINDEAVSNFSSGANYNADLRAIGATAIQAKRDKRLAMIIGEGAVFLTLLGFGIYQVSKSFKKEADMNHIQNNFLMSITHELKTPIASARLQLETLEKHTLDHAQRKAIAGNAIKDTDRLEALVDNILMVSKFEHNAIKVVANEFNLSQHISELVEQYKLGLGNKHIWHLDIPAVCFIHSDPLIWHTIFNNLIDNARKYAPIGSEIVVQLKQEGGQVVLAIMDQGIGIKESDRHNVFEKFYRVDTEEVRQSKGTGLGLYIVHKLCGALDIKIAIENNLPSGSIFLLKFYQIKDKA
jgi:signal transduction histidine kinase